ncbi:MAG: gamma-glutamyltransferase [Pirellulales bacterium]|nr:gamma-glutamyltransferase [Pirellulales bacterium]
MMRIHRSATRRVQVLALRTGTFVLLLGVLSMISPVARGYDRPAKNRHQSRSVVTATNGMVATSQPLAAQIGLDVLKQGGNAADAAIAASAAIGLMEPMSCGIGGDVFVIYWDARSKRLYGLNGSGRSPGTISRDIFAAKGMQYIPDAGPLSWSVPGCVAGWEDLRERFGTKSLAELLAPSIESAEQGFAVTEIIAAGWQASTRMLSQHPDSARTYLPGGRAPVEGEIFRNPDLARSYRALATGGRDAFYRGPLAEAIVAFSHTQGGYFELDDFAEHRSEWIEPVSTTYRGHEVWELPPNGQGIAVLQILNLLEPYDLKSMGHNSAEYLHLLIEAKKLAYADRARFYADPAFAKLPTAELISKPYADARRKLIDRQRAAQKVPPGDPKLAHGDTIYLTVVDRDRNCCSFIQSNYYGFGSGMVPGNLGFVLQNRGALFSLDPQHANTLEPRKLPFHTIIPAMATQDGVPWLVFGVMGGDMQPQGHVQVFLNMVEFGMNVQEAGDAARVRHLGSATPTSEPADPQGGLVTVESGVSEQAIAGLRAKGHRVEQSVGDFGGYQAIRIDWRHGTLAGGTEPRKDGAAVGY